MRFQQTGFGPVTRPSTWATSTEFLEALRKLPTPGLSLNELIGFVHTSDLVKFARSGAMVNFREEFYPFLLLAFLLLALER